MTMLHLSLCVAFCGVVESGGKHGARIAQFVRDRRSAAHPEVSHALRRSPPSGKRLILYRTHVADGLTNRILSDLAASVAHSET